MFTTRGRRLSRIEEMINSFLMIMMHRMMLASDFVDGSRSLNDAKESEILEYTYSFNYYY